MIHAESIKEPSRLLQFLLKALYMLNISIWYDKGIDVDYLVIKCIKCNKVVGYKLEYQTLNRVVTVFFTNLAFLNIFISWIIESNDQLKFYF